MYFFTDPTLLPQQTTAYGPISTDDYRVGAEFAMTQISPAFACQAGQLLVVESSTAGLVNLILKPFTALQEGFVPVHYYVYRGLRRDSFANSSLGTNLRSRNQLGNSELINQIWMDIDNLNAERQIAGLAPVAPVAADVIQQADAGNPTLDSCFARLTLPPITVSEGLLLGDFGANAVAFEIITDTYGVTLDLNYARLTSRIISVTGIASGMNLMSLRDSVLSYLDPCAFFGLYAASVVQVSTYSSGYPSGNRQNQALTGLSIETQVLARFVTAHRAYIDVRNEQGRSYNFAQAYSLTAPAQKTLGIRGQTRLYETDEWPIAYVDLAGGGNPSLSLQLRRDTNPKAVLYCQVGQYQSGVIPASRNFFIPAGALVGSNDWTAPLPFYFIGTRASYLKLHYYRPGVTGVDFPASSAILSKYLPLDNLFALSLQPIAQNSSVVPGAVASTPALVTVDSPAATYIADAGLYASADRVVMYLRERQRTVPPLPTDHYPPNNPNSISGGLFGDDSAGFLSKTVGLTSRGLRAANSTPGAQVLDIIAYSGNPDYRESLYLLCLSGNEWQSLRNVTGFDQQHPRYVVLTDTTPTTGLLDDLDKPSRCYSLGVQGRQADGTSSRANPATPILVYASATTNGGYVLTSAAFAAEAMPITTSVIVYPRNPEEDRSLTSYYGINTSDTTTIGEYFIRKFEDIGAAVDTFQQTLVLIQATAADAVVRIRQAVEIVGTALFTAGIQGVQAGLSPGDTVHEPDDRPLYWGRIEAAVTLKRHPFFANAANLEVKNGKSTGRIIYDSELDNIVQLLEIKSRNYRSIDFSGHSAGAKKILVTGFDPFGLDNPFSLNPSGIIASALHGKRLTKRDAGGAILAEGYVQVMIVPVRWRDFDGSRLPNKATGTGLGIIEKHVGYYLSDVDMIVTVSRDNDFNYKVERYATLMHGGDDNLGDNRQDSRSIRRPSDKAHLAVGDNLEWLTTTLPYTQMTQTPGVFVAGATDHVILDHVDVAPQPTPANINKDNPKQPLPQGSGGAYLSNEIFYRVGRVRVLNRPTLPTGHIHVPFVGPTTAKTDTYDFDELRRQVRDITAILTFIL